MNILMISNIDDDEKLEDIWLARAFQKDGHKVAIVDKNYDERLEEIFDIFILRNSWSSNATLKTIQNKNEFSKRIIQKNLARINFDGIFDGKGKNYLVDLFKKGYQVIPSINRLEDIGLLNNPDKYILKLEKSYDGIGQIVVDKKDLKQKFSDSYIIQPFMKFASEVQFYYIKDKFEYALEFTPSKIPIYPKPTEYVYTDKELEIANMFAKLNENYYGIQRIDFIKLENGTLLLTEIEDIAPYLDLDCVSDKIKNKFIKDYKDMVYEYIQNRNNIKNDRRRASDNCTSK